MASPLLTPDVSAGAYAQKQLLSGAGLVAWSHSRRFQVALDLSADAAGRRVMDYGCGDGTFLAMLLASGVQPRQTVGVDAANDLVEDCRNRLGPAGIDFLTLPELDARAPAAFDVIFCMEVLEHVVDIDEVLGRLHHSLAPGGRLVISVPVETGVPLVVKQIVRRIAGWRGIGDYPGTEAYRPAEWLPSLLAGSRQHIVRKVHTNSDGSRFHDHKGFNWMALRERIRARFELKGVTSSPFSWLPPHLGTQAWFIAEKPAVR